MIPHTCVKVMFPCQGKRKSAPDEWSSALHVPMANKKPRNIRSEVSRGAARQIRTADLILTKYFCRFFASGSLSLPFVCNRWGRRRSRFPRSPPSAALRFLLCTFSTGPSGFCLVFPSPAPAVTSYLFLGLSPYTSSRKSRPQPQHPQRHAHPPSRCWSRCSST